jgi:5S rRNA maturation endonuclease (ribonuclease M5)
VSVDAEQIKQQVDIVDVIGQFVELKKQGSSYVGNCPFHDEKNGSFNVDQNLQSFKCFGCEQQGDVIDFIQEHKNLDFKEAVKFLGGEIKSNRPAKKKAEPPKPAKYIALPYDQAKDHFTLDVMQDRADYIFGDNPHKFKQAWPYKNEKGEVEIVVARFEDEEGNKSVLSMYWDGKTIKLKNYPVLLFNRDLLTAHPEKPVLIVEGEKAATAAAELTDFVTTTWNGGGAKSNKVDWSPLKNREVFIFPDDDQQVYLNGPRKGQVKPSHEQPGNKVAAKIKKKLPHAKIVKPIIKARKVKKSGADIVEILQVMSSDEITAHILKTNGDNKSEISSADDTTLTPPPIDCSMYNFKVLGVADDGKAYFIGQNDRMYILNPTSITKTQLYNLMPLSMWESLYSEDHGTGGKMWEHAISDLIMTASSKDFDPDKMRGRGAWREPDGRICYHNGKKPVGDYSEDRLYLRRTTKNVGIEDTPATAEERERICESVKELTFDTIADCVRTLGWAVLAPFAGALPWRPAGLMTAASGTGKSTIVSKIIRPLAQPIICSGGESTSAGIRQRIGVDSCAIVVEESETDTQKKKQNRDETFSLMRQSTSDDSPDVLKGTVDGKGLSFTLRSMFFFVSISPEIECEADENRIFRVSLVKASHKRNLWIKKERELCEALTDKICRGVRAYTWRHLKDIIALAERVAIQAQLTAGADNRTAFAESLLLAAYIAVFKDRPNADDDFIIEFVKQFYSLSPLHQRRNENEEMLDIILDYIIRDSGRSYTVRELLNAIETGWIYSNADSTEADSREQEDIEKTFARQLVGRYGVGLTPDGNIAIAKNHKEIMHMLDKGKGYQMQLMRHPRLIERGKNVYLGSRNVKNCVVIGWENAED